MILRENVYQCSVHEMHFTATRFVYWQLFELILVNMRTGGHMMTVISLPFCFDIPCIPCIKLSFTTRNQNCKRNVASYLRLLQFEHVFLSNRARYLIRKL